MAVGLGRDGPQRGETLERSKAEENGEREEGEGADARAPCDREREGGGTGVGWSKPGREPGRASYAEQGCWAEGKEGGLGCLRKKELGRGAGVGPAGPKWRAGLREKGGRGGLRRTG